MLSLSNAELEALFSAPGAPSQEALVSAFSSPFPIARLHAFVNDPLVQAYFKKMLLKLRECRAPVSAASATAALPPPESVSPASSAPKSPGPKLAAPKSPGPQSSPLKPAAIALPKVPGPQSFPLKSAAAPSKSPKSPAPRFLSPQKFIFSLSPTRKTQPPVAKSSCPPRPFGGPLSSNPVDPYILVKLMILKLSAEGVVKETVRGLLEENCMLRYVVGLDADTPGRTHWERDYVVWFLIMLVENQVHGGIFKGLGFKEVGGEEGIEGTAWFAWGVMKYMLWKDET